MMVVYTFYEEERYIERIRVTQECIELFLDYKGTALIYLYNLPYKIKSNSN